MACLCGRCRSMTLIQRGLFRSGRSSGCSTGSAVVANVVSRPLVAYGLFVSVVKGAHIYVIHRGVVAESPVLPISAFIAKTTIAEAVIDAAVEADRRTPVAVIPGIGIA